MSTLQQYLKRPETYLVIGSALSILIIFDSYRNPSNQITALIYIETVHIYQAIGRPLLEGHIKCRFRPTCSEYSIQAVQKYGIRYGLYLTFNRINSCNKEIPLDSYDPVK